MSCLFCQWSSLCKTEKKCIGPRISRNRGRGNVIQTTSQNWVIIDIMGFPRENKNNQLGNVSQVGNEPGTTDNLD